MAAAAAAAALLPAPGGVALLAPASVVARGAVRPGELRRQRRVAVRRLPRAAAAAGDDQSPTPALTGSNPSVKPPTISPDVDIEVERRRKQQELRNAERAFWQRETAMWQRQRELLMLELMELKTAVQQLEQRMPPQGGGSVSLPETTLSANDTSHLDNLSREELMERAMQGIYGVSNRSFELKDEPYSNGVTQTPGSDVDLPVEAEQIVQQQQAAVEVSEPEQDLQTVEQPEQEQEQEQEPKSETQVSQAPAQAVFEDVIPTAAAESSSASAVSADLKPSSPPRVDNSAWERRRKLETQMKAMFGDLRGLLPDDLPLDLPAPSASASQSYPPASAQEDTGEGFPLTYSAEPSAQAVQDDEAETGFAADALESSEQAEGEEDYTKTTAWQRRRRLQMQMEDAMRQLAGDPEAAARADPESSQPEQPDIYAGSTRPFTSHQPPTDYPQQATAKLTARLSEDATPTSASTSDFASSTAAQDTAAEQQFKPDSTRTGPIDAIAAAAAALLQAPAAEAPVSVSAEEVSKPAPSSVLQAKAPAEAPVSVSAEEVSKPAPSSVLQAKAPAEAPVSVSVEDVSKPAPPSLQAKAPAQAPVSVSAEEVSKPAPPPSSPSSSQAASEGEDPAVVVTRWGTFRSPVIPASPKSSADSTGSASQQQSEAAQQQPEEVKAPDTVKQPPSRWGSWTSHAQKQ
eukprot:jgi/Chlat1/8038/Chrsp71S07507